MPTEFDEWGEPIVTPEPEQPIEPPVDETEPELPTEEIPPIDTEEPTEDEPLIVGEWNLTEAIEYVLYHAVDNEDFLDSDNTAKVRFLNVGRRTLRRAFKGYVIPIEAEYLFACVLNANYNDTTVMAQRGIAGFSVDGISFTFKDWAKKELDDLITDDIRDLITEANPDIDGGNSRIKWVTL